MEREPARKRKNTDDEKAELEDRAERRQSDKEGASPGQKKKKRQDGQKKVKKSAVRKAPVQKEEQIQGGRAFFMLNARINGRINRDQPVQPRPAPVPVRDVNVSVNCAENKNKTAEAGAMWLCDHRRHRYRPDEEVSAEE